MIEHVACLVRYSDMSKKRMEQERLSHASGTLFREHEWNIGILLTVRPWVGGDFEDERPDKSIVIGWTIMRKTRERAGKEIRDTKWVNGELMTSASEKCSRRNPGYGIGLREPIVFIPRCPYGTGCENTASMHKKRLEERLKTCLSNPLVQKAYRYLVRLGHLDLTVSDVGLCWQYGRSGDSRSNPIEHPSVASECSFEIASRPELDTSCDLSHRLL